MPGKEQCITATAPGNVLICGEYSILEEGGLGISVAAEPLAYGKARRSGEESTAIRIVTDEGAMYLNGAMKTAHLPFIVKVYQFLDQHLRKRGYTPPVLEVEIDTTGFFREGRKLGLGASAAASVIFAGLLFTLSMDNASPNNASPNREQIAAAAIEAHRYAQGNRGSGYDILTSSYGSAGIFAGGHKAQWKNLEANHPLFSLKAYTFPGPREVDSRHAVWSYQKWKSDGAEEAGAFFARSQNLMHGLQKSLNEEEFLRKITELRLLSTELGEHIGVESWISPPSAFYERSAWKGSGAGNELGVLFLGKNSISQLPDIYIPLNIAPEGLRIFNAEGMDIL